MKTKLVGTRSTRVPKVAGNNGAAVESVPTDPKAQLQRDALDHDPLLRWFLVGVLSARVAALFIWDRPRALARWWHWRRVCSWCQRRLGGNPWARRITHGVCRDCKNNFLHEPATDDLNIRASVSSAASHHNTSVTHPPGYPGSPTPAVSCCLSQRL